MPFQLSPGVAVVEKDFSSIVPAVSSSAGAFAGPFAWGPVEDPVRVSSETDLVSRFGTPTDYNYQSFFTAANFLAYTNNMLIVRSDASGLRNAVSVASGGVTGVFNFTAGSGYAPAITNVQTGEPGPGEPRPVCALGSARQRSFHISTRRRELLGEQPWMIAPFF